MTCFLSEGEMWKLKLKDRWDNVPSTTDVVTPAQRPRLHISASSDLPETLQESCSQWLQVFIDLGILTVGIVLPLRVELLGIRGILQHRLRRAVSRLA